MFKEQTEYSSGVHCCTFMVINSIYTVQYFTLGGEQFKAFLVHLVSSIECLERQTLHYGEVAMGRSD